MEDLEEHEEPWSILSESYRDIKLIVGDKSLMYHKAVLAQHSRLIQQLLTEESWCPCHDVVISLDGVSVESVKYVMDLIYAGIGGFAAPQARDEGFKEVVKMLMIDTIVVSDLETEDNFNLQEFFDVMTSSESSIAVTSNKDLVVSQSASTVVSDNVVSKDPASDTSGAKKRGRKRKQHDVTANTQGKDKVSSFGRMSSDGPSRFSSSLDTESKKIASVASIVTNNAKKLKENDVSEITLIDDDDIKKESIKADEVDKYLCPFDECQSESKNVQSIKIHLALVHYKKVIQAEFPNWKKQKCEECNRSIGQMTAYYLHMANHKRYKFMDYSADQLKAPKVKAGKGKESVGMIRPNIVDKTGVIKDTHNKVVSKSPLLTAPKSFTATPKLKSFSPSSNIGKISSPATTFVKTIKSPYSQVTRGGATFSPAPASSLTPSSSVQTIRTPLSKVVTKSFSSTVTPVIKAPPGPNSSVKIQPTNDIGYTRLVDKRMSDGPTQRASFIKTSLGEKSKSTLTSKDLRKQRGF